MNEALAAKRHDGTFIARPVRPRDTVKATCEITDTIQRRGFFHNVPIGQNNVGTDEKAAASRTPGKLNNRTNGSVRIKLLLR